MKPVKCFQSMVAVEEQSKTAEFHIYLYMYNVYIVDSCKWSGTIFFYQNMALSVTAGRLSFVVFLFYFNWLYMYIV